MPLFALLMLVFLVPLSIEFHQVALERLLPSEVVDLDGTLSTVCHATFVLPAIFVAAFYADMFVSGPIPLFGGIDNLEYTELFEGQIHLIPMQQGLLFAGC